MKKILTNTLLFVTFTMISHGEFEIWTNQDGNEASMKLIDVERKDDKFFGNFELRNGKKVSVDADTLSEESANRVRGWSAPGKSVFDEPLSGNLHILKDNDFVDHEMANHPKKYFVFYYTASWCQPCRQFTPLLVDFYKRNKNENFEVILVSSDRNAHDQLGYAAKNKMPWPHLKFDEVSGFKGKFNHGVRGIPAVIVCDLDGTIVEGNFRDLEALKKLIK